MDKKNFPEEIVSERIVLRKHKLELAQTMFKYINRDRVRLGRFLPWVPFIREVEDEVKYIESTHEKWAQGAMFDFSLFRREDEMYMGNIGFHTICWENEHIEIGYWILGDFEGKGYVSEAVLALEKVAFDLGFQRIEIRCDLANKRSASVPQKCGYLQEGHFRKDSKDRDGNLRDTLIFAKIRDDLKS